MLSKIRQACSKVIFSRRKQASSPEPEDTVPTLEQTSCRHYKHLPKELKDPEEKGWASFTKTGLKEEIESQLSNNEVDNVKARKEAILNAQLRDFGMGLYQLTLFFLMGLGWLFENLWVTVVSIICEDVAISHGRGVPGGQDLLIAFSVGLALGAFFAGALSDLKGRRNIYFGSMLGGAITGLALVWSSSWVVALLSIFFNGVFAAAALAVDGTYLVECLPKEQQGWSIALGAFWPCGALLPPSFCLLTYQNGPGPHAAAAYVIPFLKNDSGADAGWTTLVFIMAMISLFKWFLRIVFCQWIYESPRYLLNCGQQVKTVKVMQSMARRCGTKPWLTSEILDEIGGQSIPDEDTDLPMFQRFKSKLREAGVGHLFTDWILIAKLALATLTGFALSLAYSLYVLFLPSSLGSLNTPMHEVYKVMIWVTLVGISGPLLAACSAMCFRVPAHWIIIVSGALTAGMVAIATRMKDTTAALPCAIIAYFALMAVYSTSYAYMTMIFPTRCRGIAGGIVSSFMRVAFLVGPFVQIATKGITPGGAPYWSAGFFGLATLLSLFWLFPKVRSH